MTIIVIHVYTIEFLTATFCWAKADYWKSQDKLNFGMLLWTWRWINLQTNRMRDMVLFCWLWQMHCSQKQMLPKQILLNSGSYYPVPCKQQKTYLNRFKMVNVILRDMPSSLMARTCNITFSQYCFYFLIFSKQFFVNCSTKLIPDTWNLIWLLHFPNRLHIMKQVEWSPC
jgi:hypothetical protein